MPTWEIERNGKVIGEIESAAQPTRKQVLQAMTALDRQGVIPKVISTPQAPQGEAEGDPGWFESPSEEARRTGRPTDYNRPDNSILGMPPELVAVGGSGVGRAVAGATGAAQKTLAGAKAAATQVAPQVKYELTKTALESVGMPTAVAIPMAIAVSGYRRGAAGKPRARVPGTPAAKSPVAAAPVPAAEIAAPAPVGAPATAPVAAAAKSAMSPQRIQNDLGIAARRAGVKLTEPDYAEAAALVGKGQSPAEAVAAMASKAPVAAATKATLNAAEFKEYTRLLKAGKKPPEALKAIEEQRQLAKMMGTPSPEEARRAVADRNRTGRWAPGTPGKP